jgi:thiol-disulfide isomerase/thioredoxin
MALNKGMSKLIRISKKHLFNGLFVVLLLLVIFVPSAKAFMLRGLLEIGLFNPTVKKIDAPSTDLSTIKFRAADGKITSLADLRGKVIFLNFWATWCPPCLAEMPAINKLHQQFKDDPNVVLLMVDADGNFAKAQAYMDRKKYQLPVYAIASDIPAQLFKGTLPTTIVFDRKGRISFREEGAANYASAKFVEFIKKLKAVD